MPRHLTGRAATLPTDAESFRLVDAYITQSAKLRRHFVLPAEHARLGPLVDRYAHNFPGLVAAVRESRDMATPRSEEYRAFHELYRTLEVRLVQQQRRDRAKRALQWLRSTGTKTTYEQRQRWLRKLEQKWAKARLARMAQVRSGTSLGQLSTEEREEVLEAFWQEIDTQIARGELTYP